MQVESKKIVISGYYGFGNSGDEAVLQAILEALGREASLHGFRIEPIVLSVNPAATTALHGVKAVHRLRPLEIIRVLRESDGLVSGGGSLLQDSTGTRTIPYYLSILKLAQWLGKPTFIYAQGVGPIRQTMFHPLIRAVYNRARYISLRDRESAKLLHRIGVQGVPVDIVSDPVMGIAISREDMAFTDTADQVEQQPSSQEIEKSKPVIGVSVRPWRPDRLDLLKVAEALQGILDQRLDVQLHFLLFHPSRDRVASEYIIKQMGQAYAPRIRLFDTGDNPKEMLELVNTCDLMIGMRLHSLIYAAAYRIPMIGISYDPKIDHFLRHLGMESAGSTMNVQSDRIIQQALTLLDQQDDWARRKSRQIEELGHKSQIPAQQICHYLRIEQRKRI